jgi:hypothetical protein
MRKTVSFAQQIAIDRHYNPYVYGGNWLALQRWIGTDCSGCVDDECDAALNGTAMAWQRWGSTEDWRPPSMGGGADPANGPFGAVMVDDPSQFPSDAAVLIALHHGPGGGENSHTWCQVDQLAIETHGSCDQFPNGATVLNSRDSELFNDAVLDVHDTSYANNWWYLAGPITEDGTPVPTGPSPVVQSHLQDGLWRVGLPRRVGQTRYQDKHVAWAVPDHDDASKLVWRVDELGDDGGPIRTSYTKRLAHVDHWRVQP